MSKLIACLSTFFLVFLIIGLVVYARVYAPGGTWLRPVDAPAVVSQVRGLKELVTVRYVVQKTVGVTGERQESILLLVQGRASAGVDLGAVTQYDVQVSGKKVRIRLPHAQIFDVYLDEKNTKVWDRRTAWWTPWVSPDPELERRARLAAIGDIRKAALDMGILKDAESSARTALQDLTKAMGESVEIWNST